MSKDVFLDEMEDNSLELVDQNGVTHTLPIVGMFCLKQKHYVVLYGEDKESGKEPELILVRVTYDGKESHIQFITEVEEWNEAVETWNAIVDETNKKGWLK